MPNSRNSCEKCTVAGQWTLKHVVILTQTLIILILNTLKNLPRAKYCFFNPFYKCFWYIECQVMYCLDPIYISCQQIKEMVKHKYIKLANCQEINTIMNTVLWYIVTLLLTSYQLTSLLHYTLLYSIHFYFKTTFETCQKREILIQARLFKLMPKQTKNMESDCIYSI